MKHYIIILAFFLTNLVFGQKSVFKLNTMDDLLSDEVKTELSLAISNKDMVFLGESEHHIGSDFEAKTQFVKFLVSKHGFKHIVFEGDFFALNFTHDKNNLWPFWAKSKQCAELFTFLEENHVTIWGFDNQFSSPFSFQNFSPKLFSFLNQNKISFGPKFKTFVDIVCSEGPELKKKLDNKEISFLINSLDNLAQNSLVKQNDLWFQFLQSFKSLILQYTSPKPEGYKIRDTQMAKNLNFVAKTLKQEKIIVWAANAHISKLDQEFMDGKIMGSQFIQRSNRKTYHVAFAPIKMPYRKSKFLESEAKQSNNLLNLLPNIISNSLIFSNLINSEIPGIKLKKYIGMFGMGDTAFDYFEHFDALVFIASGEKVTY